MPTPNGPETYGKPKNTREVETPLVVLALTQNRCAARACVCLMANLELDGAQGLFCTPIYYESALCRIPQQATLFLKLCSNCITQRKGSSSFLLQKLIYSIFFLKKV